MVFAGIVRRLREILKRYTTVRYLKAAGIMLLSIYATNSRKQRVKDWSEVVVAQSVIWYESSRWWYACLRSICNPRVFCDVIYRFEVSWYWISWVKSWVKKCFRRQYDCGEELIVPMYVLSWWRVRKSNFWTTGELPLARRSQLLTKYYFNHLLIPSWSINITEPRAILFWDMLVELTDIMQCPHSVQFSFKRVTNTTWYHHILSRLVETEIKFVYVTRQTEIRR